MLSLVENGEGQQQVDAFNLWLCMASTSANSYGNKTGVFLRFIVLTVPHSGHLFATNSPVWRANIGACRRFPFAFILNLTEGTRIAPQIIGSLLGERVDRRGKALTYYHAEDMAFRVLPRRNRSHCGLKLGLEERTETADFG